MIMNSPQKADDVVVASPQANEPTIAKDEAQKSLEISDEMLISCSKEGDEEKNEPQRSVKDDDSSAIFNQSSDICRQPSTSDDVGCLASGVTDLVFDYNNDGQIKAVTSNKDDNSLVVELPRTDSDEQRSHSKLCRQQAWFTESSKQLFLPESSEPNSNTKFHEEHFDLFFATRLTNFDHDKKPIETKSADENEKTESQTREGFSSSTDNVYLCLHSSKPDKKVFFPVKSFPNLRHASVGSNGAFIINANRCQNILEKKFEAPEINFGIFRKSDSVVDIIHNASDSGGSDSHISNSGFGANCCNCQFSSPLLNNNNNSNNEFHSATCKENSLAQMLANSLAFFNIKIPDSLPLTPILKSKSKSFFSKYRSKSLTSLYDNSEEDNEEISKDSFQESSNKKPTKSFHLPSFHFFSSPKMEEENLERTVHPDSGRMSIDVKNFQAGNPAATLLLFPPKLSGAPAIFLRQDTPNNSNTPVESPIRHANRTLESSLVRHNEADDGGVEKAFCIEEVMKLKDHSECKPKFSLGDDDDSLESPKVPPCFVGSLKKRITKRPTLLLPHLGSSNDSEPESLSRRNSIKSLLSVSSPTRRPSLSSLLSASSVSLAGHRFSFNLGSRVSDF